MLALALELLDLGRNPLGDLAPEGAATLIALNTVFPRRLVCC